MRKQGRKVSSTDDTRIILNTHNGRKERRKEGKKGRKEERREERKEERRKERRKVTVK